MAYFLLVPIASLSSAGGAVNQTGAHGLLEGGQRRYVEVEVGSDAPYEALLLQTSQRAVDERGV